MTIDRKLHGGVIVLEGERTRGLIELLTFPVRDQLLIEYYSHAYQIEFEQDIDFIVVLSLEELQRVIRFYEAKQQELPLLIHIDDPETSQPFEYDMLFPGIEVEHVPQTRLIGDKSSTLELNYFVHIVKKLRSQE